MRIYFFWGVMSEFPSWPPSIRVSGRGEKKYIRIPIMAPLANPRWSESGIFSYLLKATGLALQMYIFGSSNVSVIKPCNSYFLILVRNIDPVSKNQKCCQFWLEFGFTKREPLETIRVTAPWSAFNSVHKNLIKFLASNIFDWNVPYLIE